MTSHPLRALLTSLFTVVGMLLPAPTMATSSQTPGQAGSTPKVCVAAGCWVTARIDVDGDGRVDQVSSTRNGTGDNPTWTLRVVTARGKLAQLSVRAPAHALPPAPGNVWLGAANLDGVKGAELVVGGDREDARWLYVYTWRSGRLMASTAPGGGSLWLISQDDFSSRGYTFGSSGGVRSVVVSNTIYDMAANKYVGTLTTYRWSKKSWARSSATKAALTSAQALRYAGWNRTSLPKGLFGPDPLSCKPIDYAYLEMGVIDIETTNVSCTSARSFIGSLEKKVDYTRSFTSGAYSCAVTVHLNAEAVDWADVNCISGVRFISFNRG